MSGQSDHDLHLAIMRAMWPIPAANGYYATQEEIDEARERCDKWREWVESTSLTSDERQHYQEWIAYCDYQNDRAQQEITTQAKHREYEERVRRNKEQNRRVDEITVTKPARPF